MGAYFRAAAAASALMVIVASAIFIAQDHLFAQDNPPAQPAGPPGAPPTPEPSVTVLEKHEVQGILGKDVRSAAADENMGRIVDVLVDPAGQVRAAIIDFGGFLGVGSRKIAVAWNALRFPSPGSKGSRITLELTRDQVRAAPEYKDDKPVVVLGPSGSLESLPFP
jgi:PRC-barrel domain protein